MTVHMHLVDCLFDKAAVGEKIVDARIFDEKRKLISVGTHIEYSPLSKSESRKLHAVTLGYVTFDDFLTMFRFLRVKAFGLGNLTPAEAALYMREFYTDEQIKKHGTVAIMFERLKQ